MILEEISLFCEGLSIIELNKGTDLFSSALLVLHLLFNVQLSALNCVPNACTSPSDKTPFHPHHELSDMVRGSLLSHLFSVLTEMQLF